MVVGHNHILNQSMCVVAIHATARNEFLADGSQTTLED
jgi:hypothetical protein